MKNLKLYKKNLIELINTFVDQCNELKENIESEEYFRGQIQAFNTTKKIIECANDQISFYRKIKGLFKNET